MKLFVWINNGSKSDFIKEANADFGEHSGCLVILAENKEEAKGKAGATSLYSLQEPVEIDLDTKGIVVRADGEC